MLSHQGSRQRLPRFTKPSKTSLQSSNAVNRVSHALPSHPRHLCSSLTQSAESPMLYPAIQDIFAVLQRSQQSLPCFTKPSKTSLQFSNEVSRVSHALPSHPRHLCSSPTQSAASPTLYRAIQDIFAVLHRYTQASVPDYIHLACCLKAKPPAKSAAIPMLCPAIRDVFAVLHWCIQASVHDFYTLLVVWKLIHQESQQRLPRFAQPSNVIVNVATAAASTVVGPV